MELDIMGLLGACSYALDCVEAELTHVATKHGKRVAYMSVCTAQKMGITGDALQDLAACSLLHDNALTQYIYEEFHNDLTKNNTENINVKAAWHPLHLRGGKLKNVPVSDGCEKCDFISP